MSKLTLEQKVSLLQSAVIGLIGERDPEGEYRPEFVKEMFLTLSEKPEFTFTTSERFLKHLKASRAG